MEFEKRLELITRNTREIINIDYIKSILEVKTPIVYWGTAPTGKIHIGYLLQMLKIVDYIKAGCHVKILIADLHSFLDNTKVISPTNVMDTIEFKSQYYEQVIKAIVSSLCDNVDSIEFIRGTSFQLTPQYTLDMYKVNSIINVNDAKHAGAQVVKQSESPTMTSLLYPTLQALDEIYLDVDISAGGLDQRKIMMFSKKYMPMIGYKKQRAHIMTPIMSGISCASTQDITDECSNKMSASNESSKIDILDSTKVIQKKINKAYCVEGNIEDNSLFDILDKLIFLLLANSGKKFCVIRKEEYGGNKEFDNFEQVKEDFKNKLLHPGDLKKTICNILNETLEPIRQKLNTDDFKILLKKAYP